MSRKLREAKAKAKADALTKRTTDRARRERGAFAKKLAAAKDTAKTTPASGIVDDDAIDREAPEGDADV